MAMPKCAVRVCSAFLKYELEREYVGDNATGERLFLISCPGDCGTKAGPYIYQDFVDAVHTFRLNEKSTKRYEFDKQKADLSKKIRKDIDDKRLTAKQAKAILETEVAKLKEKYFGSEEKEKFLKRREAGREKGKALKTGVKLPQTYTDYIKSALPAIYFSVGGLALAALTGNAGFFFSSLFFGFYYLVPNPENIASSSAEAGRLKKTFNDEISKAKNKDEIDEITKRYETLTNIERLLEESHKTGGIRIPGTRSYVASLLLTKGILKGLGVVTLVWTLIAMSGVIPLLGLAGLIIGFAAYFSFNPERKPEK